MLLLSCFHVISFLFFFSFWYFFFFYRNIRSLALLWFYTFGTQLFLSEDGYAREKIEAMTNLLDDCHEEYQSSAIFLFFRGRLERMKVTTCSNLFFFVLFCLSFEFEQHMYNNCTLIKWVSRQMHSRQPNFFENRFAYRLKMN